MQPDEAQLIDRATRGDETALSELLASHAPRLRRELDAKLARKWQSILEPDDILQVSFLEAFLRIERFQPRGPGAFYGWLSAIAENNLRDAVKELERQKRPQPDRRVEAVGLGDSAVLLIEQLGGTTTTPSRHVARDDLRRFLEDVLLQLPDDYSTVIRLYDLDGLAVEEVAGRMQRSAGAVFMLRARAHDRLRESLGAETRFFSRPA